MDTKIPAPLKAYLKKGKATRPKEKKILHPSYKQKQSSKQSQVVIINSPESKKRATRTKSTVKKGTDGDYPRVAYIPYSIPQMSLPSPAYQQPTYQQQPPQFHDNRSFAQYFQYNRPQEQPQEQPQEIPMQNMFQRQPAPYSLVNQPAMIQPLNPLPIEDYQVEQNLPDIPIPVANPVLPDIPLEPVRVERVSGKQRRPAPIPDEPELNPYERVFDVELDIIPPQESLLLSPSPPPPMFEERKAENELQEMFLEERLRDLERYKELSKREDIGIPPRPPRPPISPQSSIAERIDRRRENLGRPRIPLSTEDAQMISDYVEISKTIHPRDRTKEQRDLIEKGRTLIQSKSRNHKEEVTNLIKLVEENIMREGRAYSTKSGKKK